METALSSNSSSTVEQPSQWRPQVFINFRGADLRHGFISFLERDLKENGIKYYIDTDEIRGKPVEAIMEGIRQSHIALVFFSKHYANSEYCLDELVEIIKLMDQDRLTVIPIFFKVKTDDVQETKKEFGSMLLESAGNDLSKFKLWKDALGSAPNRMGLVLKEESSECEFLAKIIASLKEAQEDFLKTSRGMELSKMRVSSGVSSSSTNDHGLPPPLYGIELRIKQLEEKLDFSSSETQIVGIVGMCGIGKTTLALKHYHKFKGKVVFKKFVGVREKSNQDELWLKTELLDRTTYDEDGMFKMKMFVVLDDVSEEQQIKYLLDNRHRIQEGSKIVITTRDKSWIRGLVHDTYVVTGLNQKDALELFAFNTPTHNFTELSKQFVDYAGGNPRALEILGKELDGKVEAHQWREELEQLPRCCNEKIRTGFQIGYDELTYEQKDAFLDIACFFKSEDEDCVRSVLASNDVTDLVDKFMIHVSAGQIEMSDIMCSLGKHLGLLASAQDGSKTSRLWDQDKVIRALINGEGADKSVRGILLDVSKLEEDISIATDKLTLMPNLRYLKIFNSGCPRQCKVVDAAACKVHLPDDLNFPLEEIRYFHWLKFPLNKLPSDFNWKNLIDLRLPFSKVEHIREAVKDVLNLKRVDLSHSENLIDLSALSEAKSLERLNLEGCTMLAGLPKEMEYMKSLAFLNLRGCKSLCYLPQMKNVTTLKTLILSECEKFKNFKVTSNNLEHLHLDGTAIESLPTIKHLKRLIVLNLKNCKMLESLPDCLHRLKALEELILSGCSRLKSFPEIKEKMEKLQILLLDGTTIDVVLGCANSMDKVTLQQPPRMSGLFFLRRLCLSRNDFITRLQSSISELHHLKWMDLTYCRKLVSIPTLPPNLQCLDAHECILLKTVASPLALLTPTEQVPSSFIFTNCEKLEHVATNEITCYGHNKGRLLSKTSKRHNKGLCFEALVATCFPGSEVPAWFGHKASGAVLKPELPQHWSESGFVGIALCAIVSFENNKIQNNNLQVICICDFNNTETSSSYFNCPVGGLSESGDEQRTIKSTHVFIGYTNWLNINICQEEDGKKRCVPTKAFIKFKVTDGTREVTGCTVVKCGFSLVYESGSRKANSRTGEVEQVEKRWRGLLVKVRRYLGL